MIDKKTKKILFSIYWKEGWLKNPNIPSENEILLLRNAGLYEDNSVITHDEVIERLNKVVLSYKPSTLGNYLLASLSNRIVEYRSIFDSYCNIAPIGIHHHSGSGFCDTCGIPKEYEYEFNLTLFSAYKFGVGDKFFIMPNVFLLEKFSNKEVPYPSKNDINVMIEIIRAIFKLSPDDDANILKLVLKSVLNSNDEERHTLIEMLANAGILRPYGDMLTKYNNVSVKSNWFGPSSIWKAKNLVNINALKHYFPEYYRDFVG